MCLSQLCGGNSFASSSSIDKNVDDGLVDGLDDLGQLWLELQDAVGRVVVILPVGSGQKED